MAARTYARAARRGLLARIEESARAARATTTRLPRLELCSPPPNDLLRELLRRPTAGRESALDLLTVDALVTYAFEAAAPLRRHRCASLTTDAMTRLAATAHA